MWSIFLIYILSTTRAAIPLGTRPVISQFVALVAYDKYPNLDLITNIWKRKKGRERRKRFTLNGKFESRHLKLCNKFRVVIRCVKAIFCRPDYQKLSMCPLIKRLNRAFDSKHSAEPLKSSAEHLKHSVELLKHSVELLRI